MAYKCNYIKLEPKKPMNFSDAELVMLEHNHYPFGYFSLHILSSNKPWTVFKFDSYSRETMGKDAKYATNDLAIEGAITYLNEKGFSAQPFDLESLIDAVELTK